MNIIALVLVLFIVPAVMNILTARAAKSNAPSAEHFVMAPTGIISLLGWVCAGFFMVCIIGSSMSGQFSGFLALVFGSLFVIGLLLILAPVRGFWDVTVDGDKVTSSRLWMFKKSFNFDDIDYCVNKKGGMRVYLKGRSGPAVTIDDMSTNIRNWEKRLVQAGIEIRS